MNATADRQLHPAVLAVAGVVGLAAFAFSADSWVQLAEIAGFRTRWQATANVTVYLSWLMPLAYDAYTALATWAYFTARGERLRRYAGRSSLISAAGAVVVQGAYHGLKANHVDVASKWGLVVAVGAIPAVLLAAVVHLIAEYLRDRRPGAPEVQPARPEVQPALAPAGEGPTEPAPALVLPLAGRPAPRWVDRSGRAPLRIIPAQPPAPAQPEPAQIVIPTIDLRTAQPAQTARTNGHAHTAQPRRAAQPRAAQPAHSRLRSRPSTRSSGRTTEQRRAAVADHVRSHPGASSRSCADAIGESASTVLTDMRALGLVRKPTAKEES